MGSFYDPVFFSEKENEKQVVVALMGGCLGFVMRKSFVDNIQILY